MAECRVNSVGDGSISWFSGPMRWVAVLVAALALSSCGNAENMSPSGLTSANLSCASNVHQIAVEDSFLYVLCGCGVAPGTKTTPGTALNCTLTAPGQVRFFFIGRFTTHQIIPNGTPAFSPPSPVVDLQGKDTVVVHVVDFTASTGGQVFPFRDAFNPTLFGVLNVQ